MINKDKWISSLPKTNLEANKKINQLDHDKWISTIPKKDQKNPVKKYSFVAILFVSSLLFVSAFKNEMRNLQKEINGLVASVSIIKFNLSQTILDNEIITSPENISLLAKEYLDINLSSYKRSQIKHLDDKAEKFTEIKNKKIKILPQNIKSKVATKIEEKKLEMKKLQELYSKPKAIPNEIKTQVVKKIEEKKSELKNIYHAPKDTFTLVRVGKWSAIQIVKLFFGMPIIPGR